MEDPDLGYLAIPTGVVIIVVILLYQCCCKKLRPEDEESGWASGDDVVSSQNCVVHIALDEPSLRKQLKDLQALQQQETKNVATITETQRILLTLLQQNQSPRPTLANLKCALVIGVDATPKVFGGYCVDLQTMTLEYYTIKVEDSPFQIEARDNPTEFEMKNLQFALALWNKRIKKYKTFRIYTDNNAIDNEDNVYGEDANALLGHFENCENASKINENVHINRKKKLESFAKYIQPADDFSRWKINEGINFLCNFYGIRKQNVKGTHTFKKPETSTSNAWYDENPTYAQTIKRVETYYKHLNCENCIISKPELAGSRRVSSTGRSRRGQVKRLRGNRQPGRQMRAERGIRKFINWKYNMFG